MKIFVVAIVAAIFSGCAADYNRSLARWYDSAMVARVRPVRMNADSIAHACEIPDSLAWANSMGKYLFPRK